MVIFRSATSLADTTKKLSLEKMSMAKTRVEDCKTNLNIIRYILYDRCSTNYTAHKMYTASYQQREGYR